MCSTAEPKPQIKAAASFEGVRLAGSLDDARASGFTRCSNDGALVCARGAWRLAGIDVPAASVRLVSQVDAVPGGTVTRPLRYDGVTLRFGDRASAEGAMEVLAGQGWREKSWRGDRTFTRGPGSPEWAWSVREPTTIDLREAM